MRLVLAAGAIVAMMANVSSARGPEPRPNILFIAVDDLRCELGCYGAAHVRSTAAWQHQLEIVGFPSRWPRFPWENSWRAVTYG